MVLCYGALQWCSALKTSNLRLTSRGSPCCSCWWEKCWARSGNHGILMKRPAFQWCAVSVSQYLAVWLIRLISVHFPHNTLLNPFYIYLFRCSQVCRSIDMFCLDLHGLGNTGKEPLLTPYLLPILLMCHSSWSFFVISQLSILSWPAASQTTNSTQVLQ